MNTISINYDPRLQNGMEIHRASYVHLFPATLLEWVESAGDAGLERFKRSRLVAFIWQSMQNNGGYISKAGLESTVGNNYRDYINKLIDRHHLTVNESYSNDADHPFTKRYNFTNKHLQAELYKERIIINETKLDANTIRSIDANNWSIRNERNLKVDETKIDFDAIPDNKLYRTTTDINRINRGDYVPNKPKKSNREYNATVIAANEVKQGLVWRDGKVAINVDIRAAYPSFLGIIFKLEGLDSAKWNENMKANDFYATMRSYAMQYSSVWGELSRDEWKVEFNRFLNSKVKTKNSKSWDMMRNFIDYFSEGTSICQWICTKESIWKELEDIEVRLMKNVEAFAATNNLRYVHQHDGFISTEHDVDILSAFLKDQSYKMYGTELEIKKVIFGEERSDDLLASNPLHMCPQEKVENAYETKKRMPKNTEIVDLFSSHLLTRIDRLEHDIKCMNVLIKRLAAKRFFKSDTIKDSSDLMDLKRRKKQSIAEIDMLTHKLENNKYDI